MFLGLDLGTSGLRGLLVDETGAALASAEAVYPARHPHPGWSEQNPEDWVTALRQVIADLRAQAPEAVARLLGLGISGQMHGAVLLDQAGAVLRPCILWNDTRSSV